MVTALTVDFNCLFTNTISTPIPRSLISSLTWYSSQILSGTGKRDSFCLDAHFRFHVTEVVRLKLLPLFHIMLRQISFAATVCLGRAQGTQKYLIKDLPSVSFCFQSGSTRHLQRERGKPGVAAQIIVQCQACGFK